MSLAKLGNSNGLVKPSPVTTADPLRDDSTADRRSRTSRLLRAGILAAKIAVSAGILWLLFAQTSAAALERRLASVDLWWLGAACVLLCLQFPLAGLRWRIVLAGLGHDLGTVRLQNWVWVGQLFNQVLPTFVAGDAMRGWYAVSEGVPLRQAVSSLFWDRVLGALGLLVLVLGTSPVLVKMLGGDVGAWWVIAMAAGGVLGFALLVLLGLIRKPRYRSRFLSALETMLGHGGALVTDLRAFAAVLGLAVATNLVGVLAAYVVALSLNLPVSILDCLTLVPIALFLTLVPISIAGWGVREGTFVYLFGFVGLTASDALVLSVAFGLAMAVAAMPGAVIWLALRERTSA